MAGSAQSASRASVSGRFGNATRMGKNAMVRNSELLECLRFIRGHLYAATIQIQPRDDRIISNHINEAYTRCVELLRECDESREVISENENHE